jgi:predicted RNase H-like HicB family nuclease
MEDPLMEFQVIIHAAEEGGYWTEIPALPGCFSQGEAVEDTLSNIRDAIECHLDLPTASAKRNGP